MRAGLDVERSAAASSARPPAADAPQELVDRGNEVRRALADRASEHQRRSSAAARATAGRAGELAPRCSTIFTLWTSLGQIASQ
jgi:hypothetical protein